MPAPAESNPPFHFNTWNRNQGMCRAQGLSLALHSVVALLLAFPVYRSVVDSTSPDGDQRIWERVVFPRGGGGGGGNRNPVPATRGNPPRVAKTQITPPAIPLNATPKLPETATLQGPPEIRLPSVPLTNYGLPTAPGLTDSAGPGGGNGFGTGCCGGVGPGQGKGFGPGKDSGFGGGEPEPIARGTSMPECVYCPNPAFSDEARKSKTQGVVVLRLVVMPDGRAANISVVKGVGVGLDERAVEVVQTWRFRPAKEMS
jgi:periplasmic protein TonB